MTTLILMKQLACLIICWNVSFCLHAIALVEHNNIAHFVMLTHGHLVTCEMLWVVGDFDGRMVMWK